MKHLRKGKSLSQASLATRSGVAQGYISQMESGSKRNPGIETLRKIAKALDVEVGRLLE